MPTSHYYQLNEIVKLIIDCHPKSVLDIGVGFGKFGYLAREYLELWDGREKYDDWKVRIDGIEGFEEYLTPAHDFIYDNIYIGNAIKVLPTLEIKYDLVLIIDVLEHFDYDDGIRLLQECLQLDSNVIIATPKDVRPQGKAFGNHLEIHKFQWKKEHLEKLGDTLIVDNEHSLICLLGKGV